MKNKNDGRKRSRKGESQFFVVIGIVLILVLGVAIDRLFLLQALPLARVREFLHLEVVQDLDPQLVKVKEYQKKAGDFMNNRVDNIMGIWLKTTKAELMPDWLDKLWAKIKNTDTKDSKAVDMKDILFMNAFVNGDIYQNWVTETAIAFNKHFGLTTKTNMVTREEIMALSSQRMTTDYWAQFLPFVDKIAKQTNPKINIYEYRIIKDEYIQRLNKNYVESLSAVEKTVLSKIYVAKNPTLTFP